MVIASDDADGKAQRDAKKTLKENHAQGRPIRRRPELRLYEGYARPRPVECEPGVLGTVFSPYLVVRTLTRESGPYRELDLLCAPQVAQRFTASDEVET